MRTRFLQSVWLPLAVFFLPQFLFAQGALTPPGAPAPTMKTLAQVEPRTPISSAPFTIANPGSYYLTTNLFGTSANNGITISSGNVVLDLEGFALSGVTGGNFGIYVNSTCTNVAVRNGTLRGWSSGGVASSGQGVLLERLHAFANGGYGLHIGGGGSIVRDCSAVSNASSGVYSGGGVVSGCAVLGNGDSGVYAYYSSICNCEAQGNKNSGIMATYSTVDNCQAQNNANSGIWPSYSTVRGCLSSYNGAYGVYATASSVQDCQVQYNSDSGVYAMSGCTVSGCTLAYNGQSGIYVYLPGCQIIGNTCYNNNTSFNTGHAGIYIDDANNRVDGNHVTASGYAGIAVASGYTGNVIIRNTVCGTNNYLVSASSVVGPLITTTGTITNANPWANFSF